MLSQLLCIVLLGLLCEYTDGQYGGDVYFPEYDPDEDNGGYYSRGWPPKPRWPDFAPRPIERPQPFFQSRPTQPRPNVSQQPVVEPRPNVPQPSAVQTQPSAQQDPNGQNTLGSQNLRGLPLEDCGTTIPRKILGGEVASPGQFPWSALLQYRNGRGRLSFECGGALINKRYIVTAAHCLHKRITRDLTLVSVRLGELDTSKQDDCMENSNTGDTECADPPQDFGIEQQILHPQYSAESESKNDIGLIRLNRDVPTTDYIRPICLPTGGNVHSNGDNMIVSGWGITESGQKSPQLRYVALPTVDLRTCSSQLNKNLDSSQLCAGGQRGKDSCRGDSGGPLIDVGTINNDNRFIIRGIVSFGPRKCGSENRAGVYTQISAFTDWILQNINR